MRDGKMLGGTYEVRLIGDSVKHYNRLDDNMTHRVNEAIKLLEEAPSVNGERLKEKRYRGLYKLRVGRYRIFYEIDRENRVCYVQSILTRGRAYKR